jgi:type I restriction enzyme, R subunit
MDDLSFFVLSELEEAGLPNADRATSKITAAFGAHPDWRRSEQQLRDLRQRVTFALIAEEDDIDKVATLVERLFSLLSRRAK